MSSIASCGISTLKGRIPVAVSMVALTTTSRSAAA
jgi:hypothetical protein